MSESGTIDTDKGSLEAAGKNVEGNKLPNSGDNDTSSSVLSALSPDLFDEKIEGIKISFISGNDNTEELKVLLNDTSFVFKLNEYIFSSFRRISKDSSHNSYNEIHFLIYLLSIRFSKDFFDDGDIYSEKNFLEIFDAYISKIKIFQDLDSEEAESYIDSFSRLCGVLNLICILSQNDNLKREFIFSLSSLMFNKINDLLSFLSEKGYNNKKIKNSLEYILGLLPLNFSYIIYVNFDEKNDNGLNDFLLENKNIIESTIKGYYLCEESEFGNDLNRKDFIKRVTLINLTNIVSTILLKINGKVNEKNILENEYFQSIINSFLEYVSFSSGEEKKEYSSLEDIKKVCNTIFIKNYEGFPQDIIDFNGSSEMIVLDFLDNILKNPLTTQVDDLELMYHLVLLNEGLSKDILLKVLNLLYLDNSNGSSNINFEVIKLKIFNLILTRLVKYGDEDLKSFLGKLASYIDKNKISSHLLFAYSLMYVSIGYCYSFFDDEESQKLAFENYAKFKQINYGDFDFTRYGIDIEKFYSNIGRYKFIKYEIVGHGCNNIECSLNGKGECFSNATGCKKVNLEDVKKTGKGQLEEFSATYVEQKISNLLNELDIFISSQKNKSLDLGLLSTQVSNTLSSLFHGVAEIEILDKHGPQKNKSIPRYNTYIDFPLFNGYTVRMIYPNTFASYFETLYRTFAKIGDSEDIILAHPNGVIGAIFYKIGEFLEKFKEENKIELELVADFENALENNRLFLVYQGIHNSDGKFDKIEALTRVLNPKIREDGKEFNIRQYIDAAIKMGRKDLLRKLIEYTIYSSTGEILDYSPISINTEYLNIIDEETITLLESLKDVSKITIELIEGKWENDEAALINIKRLKDKGFKIAMDDFGTGESSMTRLKKLLKLGLIDFVKIDGDIITDLDNDNFFSREDSKDFIEAIVKMCKRRGVGVIAEFVGNQKIFDTCKRLGVDLFQGYHFSKAVCKEELLSNK